MKVSCHPYNLLRGQSNFLVASLATEFLDCLPWGGAEPQGAQPTPPASPPWGGTPLSYEAWGGLTPPLRMAPRAIGSCHPYILLRGQSNFLVARLATEFLDCLPWVGGGASGRPADATSISPVGRYPTFICSLGGSDPSQENGPAGHCELSSLYPPPRTV